MKSPLPRRIIIFIVGPTAIGKTRLAIKLAKKIDGEIISCDSMQVYKGMSVLSQAPSDSEIETVRHHLVGILDPKREYSAATFVKKVAPVIEDLFRRRRTPIVAGGSGLYAKALIDGLFSSPPADLKFRKRMEAYAKRYGSARLHARLKKIDPDSAVGIHPNDVRRMVRALEIFELTGRTMTEMKLSTKGLKDCYDIKIFGLIAPRENIYSRIGSRVDKMFADGVAAEAGKLMRKRMSKTARAALGLKEIEGYLAGERSEESAREMLKANTRRFAKRQLTWFRRDKRIKWYDITRNTDGKILKRIASEVR